MKERKFWSLLTAILITAGTIISIYHGLGYLLLGGAIAASWIVFIKYGKRK